MTAQNKPYDGSRNATISNADDALSGLANGDNVSFTTSTTASFASASVGSNKLVTGSGFSLFGPDAADYILNQPTAYANITGSGPDIATGGSLDIATLANPFFCNVNSGDRYAALCTTRASNPAPIHIFYNIPTGFSFIREEY
jgi:hypothetical protein